MVENPQLGRRARQSHFRSRHSSVETNNNLRVLGTEGTMTVTRSNGTTATAAAPYVPEKEKKCEESKVWIDRGEENDIKPEDLAPDGGWGWMVAIAMIIVFITTIGPAASFAIVFGDFLEATGQAGTATTLFNSVFMISFSIAGFLTNTLLKRYSMRPVGVVGSLFFALPNVALAFVNNVYEIAFIYFLQGIGLGLIITICNTNFNAYFVTKRAQVMSAAQVLIGLGGIVYPILLEKMMTIYGFRGTAAMTGALSLNCIAGMTMMHPVEWHAKKPEEVLAERARKKEERKLREIAMSKRRSTIDDIRISSKTKWSSLRSLKEESGKEVPLLVETMRSPAARVASISEMEDGMRGRGKFGSLKEPLSRRMSTLSASSVANLVTGIGALRDIRQLQLEKNREKHADGGYKEKKHDDEHEGGFLEDLLEVSLLKDCGFLNVCLGISFILTGDYIFACLVPLMMTNSGYTKSDAALAVTVSATAELASRILVAIFTLFVDVKARYLFFVAMICMAFAKIGFLLFEETLTGALVSMAVIGIVRSWLLVPQPLVIIENISVNHFASAYGIYAIISGIISIVFGPLVGIVKDWTNSYAICQLALLVMNVLFVVPWAAQILLVDLPKMRKERSDKKTVRTSGFFSAD
ncbi:hypothetical protein KM043_008982 [Ampulex compressa]|nr:hypothetical protein KM043_008982 [Ampulex compressa]